MKIVYLITLIVGFSLINISCKNSSVENSKIEISQKDNEIIAKDISVEEFRKLIGEEAVILDVRRKVEYDAGHLKGALNIDWFGENFTTEVSKLDRNKKILIHCASGGRSSSAMSKLKGLGFTEMYNMLGGFNAWKAAGYEFEK